MRCSDPVSVLNMVLSEKLQTYRVILASSSPRRHELLRGLGVEFEVIVREVDETAPPHLKAFEIPLYLAGKKADAFDPSEFGQSTLVITADTIVWLNGYALNKPRDASDALDMLMQISGCTHEVFTGVCLRTPGKRKSFYAESRVRFRELSAEEARWYIGRCKPFDKAGAYGIQEWIGYVGIEHIEGSFYNVMGLPTQKLYLELMNML